MLRLDYRHPVLRCKRWIDGLVLEPFRTPICCEACSVLGLSVSVFIVPSKRTCSMHCALCSIWSSQPQTRGRGGVQASSKASAPPALIWYVRPCGLCCVCAGWWLDMCVPECSRKKTFFLEHFCSVLFLLYLLNDTYILDIMIQWSTHCMAYHMVYRFSHLKVMEPMFTSCSRLQQRNQDLIIYRQQQSKQGLMFSSMTNDCATAQAVQHSENKWIKTQSLPVITYQCYRSTTVEENRWVFHIGF